MIGSVPPDRGRKESAIPVPMTIATPMAGTTVSGPAVPAHQGWDRPRKGGPDAEHLEHLGNRDGQHRPGKAADRAMGT